MTALQSLFGGGGAPDPAELTRTAQELVLDSDLSNKTDLLASIARDGVEDPEQLEVIEAALNRSEGGWFTSDWGGAHQVVVSVLEQDDLSPVQAEIAGNLMEEADSEPGLDETSAVLASLAADGLTENHNRLAVIVAEVADWRADFGYGNERLETAFANPRLSETQVDTIQTILRTSNYFYTPDYFQSQAVLDVAASSPFDSATQDLVETIARQAVREENRYWSGANSLIQKVLADPPSQAQSELGQAVLNAPNLAYQSRDEWMEAVLEARSPSGNVLELVKTLAENTSHGWESMPIVGHILRMDGISDQRLDLAKEVAENHSRFDQFETNTALTTVLEAERIEDGPQTDAMKAVLKRVSSDPSWTDGNALFRFLSTKPDLKSGEADKIKDYLANDEIDAYTVIVAEIDNLTAERALTEELLAELTEADTQVATAEVDPLSEAQTHLVDLVFSRGQRFDFNEGGGNPILTAGLHNRGFNEHNLALLEGLLERDSDRHDLMERAAATPDLTAFQVEGFLALYDGNPGSRFLDINLGKIAENPNFGRNHVVLVKEVSHHNARQSLKPVYEASSISDDQALLATALVRTDTYEGESLAQTVVTKPVSAQQRQLGVAFTNFLHSSPESAQEAIASILGHPGLSDVQTELLEQVAEAGQAVDWNWLPAVKAVVSADSISPLQREAVAKTLEGVKTGRMLEANEVVTDLLAGELQAGGQNEAIHRILDGVLSGKVSEGASLALRVILDDPDLSADEVDQVVETAPLFARQLEQSR